MSYYIFILIVPLLLYAASSVFILFHLKRYAIAGDLTQKIIKLFIAASIVLIIFTSWSFFTVPWSELNLTEMIRSALGDNPAFYPQQ